jgi:hypothetical protein
MASHCYEWADGPEEQLEKEMPHDASGLFT